MYRMAYTAIALALVWNLSASALPQAPVVPKGEVSKLSSKILLQLVEAGLDEKSLLEALQKNGTPLLSRSELARLKQAGAPAGLVKKLQQAQGERTRRPLSKEGVVQMVRAGLDQATILKAIKSSSAGFHLTTQEVLDLVLKEDVPGVIVNAMKTAGGDRLDGAPAQPLPRVTLLDIRRFMAAGLTPDWILARIKKTKSRFHATPDDLIELSRQGVPKDLLKEIWERSRKKPPAQSPAASRPAAKSKSGQNKRNLKPWSLRRVVDEGLGFSLLVPAGWTRQRDRRGGNDLVSFRNRPQKEGAEPAEGEIQVARFRASHPERLTAANLRPIAHNFLNALTARFAQKKITIETEPAGGTWISGWPAVAYKAVSSQEGKPSMQGMIYVGLKSPFVFMLSYAAQAAWPTARHRSLTRSLLSFTLEHPQKPPALSGSVKTQLAALFERWKESLAHRDYVAFRALHERGVISQEEQESFLDLSSQVVDGRLRLGLGDLQTEGDPMRITYRLIEPLRTAFRTLLVRRGQHGFRLVSRQD